MSGNPRYFATCAICKRTYSRAKTNPLTQGWNYWIESKHYTCPEHSHIPPTGFKYAYKGRSIVDAVKGV